MFSRPIALALLASALGLGVAAPTAAATNKTPCWKRVIADWSRDGVINGHYPVRCLRKAIKKTPEDLRDYSGIIDDINAALVDAGALPGGKGKGGGGGGGGGGPGQSGGSGAAGGSTAGSAAAKRAVPGAGTPSSAPAHDRSIPLPLILLGALVLIGALAAAAPHGIKWYRGRFPRVPPTPGSVRPPA